MGVMCSLFGHDYGDPDVERERDEEGTEVVVTAKRVERCHKCGDERTIAENTEVTALSAAAGVVRDPDGTVIVPSADTAAADDATAVDGGPADPKPLGTESEAVAVETVADGNGSPSAGGGSIADAVTATSALDRPTGDPADPAQAETDESRRANDDNEPAVDRIRDGPPSDDPAPDDRPYRAPGEWPDESGPASNPVGDGGTNGPASGMGTRNETEIDTIVDGSSPRARGSFVCSSCEFGAAVADSPLRAGDICPDCGVGYLALETRKG